MYCSIEDMINFLGESELIQLANTQGIPSNEIDLFDEEDVVRKRIEQQIEAAEEEINPYLENLNVLPFSTVPKRIKHIAVRISTKNLYELVPSFKEELPEGISKMYDRAIAELEKYRSKKLSLGVDDAGNFTNKSGTIVVNKTEDDRQFPKSLLDKM